MQSHGANFSSERNIKQGVLPMFRWPFISQCAKSSYHARMEKFDVFDVRREKLAELLSKRGAAARIAAKTGTAASYLSTVKNGDRRLGDDLARRIEEAEGLEYGWLDRVETDHIKPKSDVNGADGLQNLAVLTSEENAVYIQASSPEDLARQLKERGEEEIMEIIRLLVSSKDSFLKD